MTSITNTNYANPNSKILIAEDNTTNQVVVICVLEKLGLKADIVDNGQEAIDALEKNSYDLVLMDIQMPVLDGLEATRIIRERKLGGQSHIPIIALTASVTPGERENFINSGMDDYVSKPIDLEEFRATMHKWLALPQATTHREAPESCAPNSNVEIFDCSTLLRRVQDDENIARKIIEVFLSDIPTKIKHLEEYLHIGDAKNSEITAHAIKGAAANVSGNIMRQVAFEMEKAAKAQDLSAALSHLKELHRSFIELTIALKEWSGNGK